jgi:hypothetical protein
MTPVSRVVFAVGLIGHAAALGAAEAAREPVLAG